MRRIYLFPRSEQAYHLHLEMMSMEEAKSFCNKLQSGLVIPRYEKENELLYNTAYEYNSHCNANSYATAFVWIGATDILEESVWTDFKVRNEPDACGDIVSSTGD